MGVRPGVSDFILIHPVGGRVHALELKREGEKPTAVQIEFMNDVKLAGGVADWVDTYKAAVEVLKGWGALPDKIKV